MVQSRLPLIPLAVGSQQSAESPRGLLSTRDLFSLFQQALGFPVVGPVLVLKELSEPHQSSLGIGSLTKPAAGHRDDGKIERNGLCGLAGKRAGRR